MVAAIEWWRDQERETNRLGAVSAGSRSAHEGGRRSRLGGTAVSPDAGCSLPRKNSLSYKRENSRRTLALGLQSSLSPSARPSTSQVDLQEKSLALSGLRVTSPSSTHGPPGARPVGLKYRIRRCGPSKVRALPLSASTSRATKTMLARSLWTLPTAASWTKTEPSSRRSPTFHPLPTGSGDSRPRRSRHSSDHRTHRARDPRGHNRQVIASEA